jgi:hypothetical protein
MNAINSMHPTQEMEVRIGIHRTIVFSQGLIMHASRSDQSVYLVR